MAFKPVRFPPAISLGAARGGLGWQTNIVRVNSGHEFRNRTQSMPLSRWDVSHAGKKERDWEKVRNFHYVMGGRESSFLFKDWSDYTADDTEGIFEMLTSSTFQMLKAYAIDDTYIGERVIYKPAEGTITVTGGTLSTIDYDTGIVTMAVGSPWSWSGEFDIPARFDIDQLPTQIVDKRGRDGSFILTIDQVPIQEVRDIA